MSPFAEVAALEESLRLAELGPNPEVFERVLADDAVLVDHNGFPITKEQVVEAHRPGNGPKFTSVEMKDLNIVENGDASIVTCTGTYEGPNGRFSLKFLRVWLWRDDRFQIVAASIHA